MERQGRHLEGQRFHLSPEAAVARCDENTVGVVAILGSTFDGSDEPAPDICPALDRLHAGSGLDIPVHFRASAGRSGATPAPSPTT